jgi:general secretion pathway protein G
MNTTIRCTKCGNENGGPSKFCSTCGNALAPTSPNAVSVSVKKGLPFSVAGILALIVVICFLVFLFRNLVSPSGMLKNPQRAQLELEALATAVGVYHLSLGEYPTNEQGLNALRTRPDDLRNWDGPYLDHELPKDPWGRDYLYTLSSDRSSVEITCLGADGKPGGVGPDQDLVVRLPQR